MHLHHSVFHPSPEIHTGVFFALELKATLLPYCWKFQQVKSVLATKAHIQTHTHAGKHALTHFLTVTHPSATDNHISSSLSPIHPPSLSLSHTPYQTKLLFSLFLTGRKLLCWNASSPMINNVRQPKGRNTQTLASGPAWCLTLPCLTAHSVYWSQSLHFRAMRAGARGRNY